MKIEIEKLAKAVTYGELSPGQAFVWLETKDCEESEDSVIFKIDENSFLVLSDDGREDHWEMEIVHAIGTERVVPLRVVSIRLRVEGT